MNKTKKHEHSLKIARYYNKRSKYDKKLNYNNLIGGNLFVINKSDILKLPIIGVIKSIIETSPNTIDIIKKSDNTIDVKDDGTNTMTISFDITGNISPFVSYKEHNYNFMKYIIDSIKNPPNVLKVLKSIQLFVYYRNYELTHELVDYYLMYSLDEYVKYTPTLKTLTFIIEHLDMKNTILKLLDYKSKNRKYYSIENIQSDIWQYYMDNEQLIPFAVYKPSVINLQFIRANIKHISLFLATLETRKTEYVNYTLDDLPSVLNCHSDINTIEFAPFTPSHTNLEFIRSNIDNKPILLQLLKTYKCDELPGVFDYYLYHYEALEKYMEYNLRPDELLIIINNREHDLFFIDLLKKYKTFHHKLFKYYLKLISTIMYSEYIKFFSVDIVSYLLTFHNEQTIEPLNVGIEIEGCTKEFDETQITRFSKETDPTVVCEEGEIVREYKIIGYIRSDKLKEIRRDIKIIFENLTKDGKAVCKSGYANTQPKPLLSCGVHFHISCDKILFNSFGLLFLVNLVDKWIKTKQEFFIIKYPYQARLYSSSYDKPAITMDALQIYKHQIIQMIKPCLDVLANNRIEYNLNILSDKDYEANLQRIYTILKNYYNKSTFFNIYDDNKFIHIEFRGLSPVKNQNISQTYAGENTDMDAYEGFENYVRDIAVMYDEVVKQTITEINEIERSNVVEQSIKEIEIKRERPDVVKRPIEEIEIKIESPAGRSDVSSAIEEACPSGSVKNSRCILLGGNPHTWFHHCY